MGTLSIQFSTGLSGRNIISQENGISCLNSGNLLTIICVYYGYYGHNVKLDCRLWLQCTSLLLSYVASSVGNTGTLSIGFLAGLLGNKDFARK